MFRGLIFKFVSIILFFAIAIISLTLIVQAQGIEEEIQYELKNSYLKVQGVSRSEKISLVREENGNESLEEVELTDEYLLSDIPENEFLNKYLTLKPGFRDLKISIEVDQPLFAKENFYHPMGILDKTKSLFGSETLPEHRIRKEIKPLGKNLETELEVPGLNLKTYYERKDKGVKQKIVVKNNSTSKINAQLKLAHKIGVSEISFDGEEYLISETPQSLSPKAGSSISFISNIDQEFTYDFSDLLEFNPSIWIFQKDLQNIILVEIPLSIDPGATIIIDPSYLIENTSNSGSTASPYQRKTWFDGARYWVSFWDDSANRIEFHYDSIQSAPSWTENTNARYAGLDSNDFSILCDSADCYIIGSNGSDIGAAKASGYPASNFSWGTTQAVETSVLTETWSRPYINKDGNDYIWAIYRYNQNTTYRIVAKRSSNASSVSAWGTRYTLNNVLNNDNWGSVIAPINATSDMYAVWIDNDVLEGNSYTGGSWDTATTIQNSAGHGSLAQTMSIVHDDNYDLHLAYAAEAARSVNYQRYYNSSSSWSNIVTLDSSSREDYVTISIEEDSQDLYTFWRPDRATSFSYRRGESPYTSTSDWTSEDTFYESEDNNTIDWLTSNYSEASNRIFAEWTEASTSNYDVMWGSIPTACTLGSIILNGGDSISLTEGGTTTISATGTFSDPQGWQDVAGGGDAGEVWAKSCNSARLYRSGVSGATSCSADDNNCYGTNDAFTCATSNCSGNSCDFSFSTDVWFHADPTDSGTWSSEDWRFFMIISDVQKNSDTATTSEELNTLQALDISTSSIDYSDLDPGENTGTLSETTTITDTGNVAIDIYLYGDDMESALSSIAIGQQEYATSSSVSYGSGTDATSTDTNAVEMDLSKPTAHSPNTSTDDIYWGLEIPSIQKAGSYTGTNTFESKSD